MLHKHSRSLVLLLGLCAACADDDDVDGDVDGGRLADGGAPDGSAADARSPDAGTDDTLQAGTYNVSDVQRITDGCDMDLDDGAFTTQELVNTGTTISLGTYRGPTDETSWTPAGYANGTGPWLTARTTTLTVTSRVRFTEEGQTCEFDTTRTSDIVYTGPNAISVDFKNNQSNHSAGCAALGFPSSNCSSNFTYKLSKPIE